MRKGGMEWNEGGEGRGEEEDIGLELGREGDEGM